MGTMSERLSRPGVSPRPRTVSLFSSPSSRSRGLAPALGLLFLAAAAGCDSGDGTGGGGAGGSGGGAGGTGSMSCLDVPLPTFELRVLAQEGGPVPPDTTVEVTWSAGKELPFHLDEPETWGTLETSNIVCDVDPSAPPPVDLIVLSCALWTSSPTQVRVSAKGHVPQEDTYVAEPAEECPEPTPIEIELALDHE